MGERTRRKRERPARTDESGSEFQSPATNTGFARPFTAFSISSTESARSFAADTLRCVQPTKQSSNSARSSTRGSAPGKGIFSTDSGFSRESSITPYPPPWKLIVFAKVGNIPVRRPSSCGSSIRFERFVLQSSSWRAAKRGRARFTTAAMRARSNCLSMPSQWRTL